LPAPFSAEQTAGVWRLAKFADQLSGTRHFKVPLYPIEDHLAQCGPWPNRLDGEQKAGCGVTAHRASCIRFHPEKLKMAALHLRAAAQSIFCGIAYPSQPI
jgi:hypothetical protein